MAEVLKPEEHALVAAAFDVEFYRRSNPDVAEAGFDPLDHFLIAGWREDRDPGPDFSLRAYLDANEDVALAGINPFLHYLAHGRTEGRPLKLTLGFRHAILNQAVPLESRLEIVRGHDLPGGSKAALTAALARLGPRLFVTVSHDAYVERVGGVQLCLKREAAALATQGWSRLHLYPALPSLVADFETLKPVVGLLIDDEKQGLFDAALIVQALAARAQAGAFGEVRFAVHSILGHSIGAVAGILEAAGAHEGFLWLHDQSSLCASYALLRNDVAFCGAPPVDSQACAICVYGLRRRVQIADHMAFFKRFSVTVLAPSQAQLDLWKASCDYPAAAAHVHPHAALIPRPATAAAVPDGPLRVAFLGFPASHKGWPIFTALAERFAQDLRYAFLHLGKQDDEPPPTVEFIAVDPPADPGGGASNAMVEAVEAAGVDVALILSICPETFCFTAHEAAAGGAAVVGFADSGAVARFAAEPGRGRVVLGEAELAALFETGEIIDLARAVRRPGLFDLRYSRMTVDFLAPATAP